MFIVQHTSKILCEICSILAMYSEIWSVQVQIPGKECYDDQNLEQISRAPYFFKPPIKS